MRSASALLPCTRAAICRPRGQVAASAAAGAPASASRFPARGRSAASPPAASLFFVPRTRALNPVNSSNCAGPGAWPVRVPRCYSLLRGVTTAVTAKPLLLHGFRGLLPVTAPPPSLYVRAGARVHMSISLYDYGNSSNNSDYRYASKAYALLAALPGAAGGGNRVTGRRALAGVASCGSPARIKIGGGYSAWARRLPGGADLHLPGAEGGRNFWASGRLAAGGEGDRGGGGADLQLGATEGGNGGKLPFSVGSPERVGTVALEGWSETAAIIEESEQRRKLSRLPHRGEEGPISRGRPAPPFGPSRLPCMSAEPFFRIWIAPSIDRPWAVSGEAPNSWVRLGLGVSGRSCAEFAGRRWARANSGSDHRVGDGHSSVSRGHSEAATKLAAGGRHVNA